MMSEVLCFSRPELQGKEINESGLAFAVRNHNDLSKIDVIKCQDFCINGNLKISDEKHVIFKMFESEFICYLIRLLNEKREKNESL